jgi:leucyl-tRNA synthetase
VSAKHESSLHKLIKKVTDDYNSAGFNTAIAAMMGFINEVYADRYITKEEFRTLLKLYHPVAPHITEELNEILGYDGMLAVSEWPEYDPAKLLDSTVTLPIQICGKMRGTVDVRRDATLDEVKEAIKGNPVIFGYIDGKTVIKEIYVPNRICNFIVK